MVRGSRPKGRQGLAIAGLIVGVLGLAIAVLAVGHDWITSQDEKARDAQLLRFEQSAEVKSKLDALADLIELKEGWVTKWQEFDANRTAEYEIWLETATFAWANGTNRWSAGDLDGADALAVEGQSAVARIPPPPTTSPSPTEPKKKPTPSTGVWIAVATIVAESLILAQRRVSRQNQIDSSTRTTPK